MQPLPEPLTPSSTHRLQLTPGEFVLVAKATPRFRRSRSVEGISTFGGKPLLDGLGGPCFAELLVTRLLLAAGWGARWIETYPPRAGWPLLLLSWDPRGIALQQSVPIPERHVVELLQHIAHQNGGRFSGCWDVIAWDDDRVIFFETKHAGRDRINRNQVQWFEAAVRVGLAIDSFFIVEWSAEAAA